MPAPCLLTPGNTGQRWRLLVLLANTETRQNNTCKPYPPPPSSPSIDDLELPRVSQMEQMDLAWIIFGGLKALGVEPADYPPINTWMAKRVLAGMTPTCLPEQQQQVCYTITT